MIAFSIKRMRVKPLLVSMLSLVAASGKALASDPCPAPAAETPTVRLAGTDTSGDLLLDDGRRIRLVGLAPRQDDAETERFVAALAAWQGRDLRIVILAEPDRWGRIPARLLAEPDTQATAPVDLSVALIRSGAAWHLPDSFSSPCDALLRASAPKTTASARQTGPKPANLVDGHDIAALKVHAGRVIVLEGRIASIGERPQRSYLNFSRRRGAGASVVVSRRLWREMREVGWTARTLTGKRVWARGVLSGPDGLSLELPSRAALELID